MRINRSIIANQTESVPVLRTLTINGTTYDLTENRSWTVGGGGGGTVTSVGLSSATSGVTIGGTPITTSGTLTIAIATASGSSNGLLSSTDWITFNNKQNTIINPVTGTGTTNYLSKWTSVTALGNSLVFDNGTNVGIGTATPGYKLEVNGTGKFTSQLFIDASASAYLRGGDDAELWDINNANTLGVYGVQNSAIGAIKLGSGGPTLYGSSSNLILNSTTDSGESFQVNGTTQLKSFTGVGINADASTMLYVQGANTTSTDFSAVFQNSNFDNLMKIHNNGKINMGFLPTSATGLSSGDIWNDSGTLKIV